MKNFNKLLLTLLLFIIIPFSFAINADDYKNNNKNIQEDTYLSFSEKMPELIGEWKDVYSKIKYTEIALRARVSGKAFYILFINEEGIVDKVYTIKPIGYGLDEQVEKIFKDLKFKPGENGGVPVKVKLSIPVEFKTK